MFSLAIPADRALDKESVKYSSKAAVSISNDKTTFTHSD